MLIYENYVDVLRDQTASPEIVKLYNPTHRDNEEMCYQVSVYVAGKLGRDSFIIEGYNFMKRNRAKEFDFDKFDSWAKKQPPELMNRRW
jgi:hypothetical protein